MKRCGFWFVRLILIAASIALAMVSASRGPAAYAQDHVAAHLPTDWSHRHVVFSAPGSTEQASMLQAEPRYWHQWFRRNKQTLQASDSRRRGLEQLDGEDHDRDRDHHRRRAKKNRLHGDWGMSLGAGATGGDEMYPAKFTFDVNATPSCANDFVVFNTGVAGGVPTAAARTGTFTAIQPVGGNTVTIGGTEILTASANLPATGTVTVAAVPNAGDTVTIGSTTYRYVVAPAVANDVLIVAGSISNSAASLRAAINANSSQCSPTAPCFGTGTTANASVTATRTSNVVTVTAIIAGAAGNSIVFTTASGGRITLSPSTGTLSGGVDGSNTGTNFLIGANTTATATNLAAAITRNGGTVGVTATSSTRIVTVTATTAGPAGNSITLATNISSTSFAWGGPTLAGGANAPGTIIGFNNLYSTQNGTLPAGLCGSAGPSILFSYNTDVGTTGTGTTTGATTSSPVLSLDGSKIAFVESGDPGGAILRLVKWAADPPQNPPAAPDQVLAAGSSWTACNLPSPNSCLIGLRFNNAAQGSESAPFYVYGRDTLYVGDDTGKLHKFINVFGVSGSTPSEVTTGGWPVTVNGAGNVRLHSPIYDSVSGNIFVGDLSGNFYYVREVGSSAGVCGSGSNGGVVPCLGTTNGLASGPTSIALGGVIDDAPIVDSTTQKVFFFDGSVNTGTCAAAGTNAVLVQLDTQLTSATEVKVCFPNNGTNGQLTNTKSGAFDNAYVSSAMGSKAGKLYFCARSPAFRDHPALFRIGFNINGVMNSTVDANSGGVGNNYLDLVTTSGEECSPITEIYNTSASTDWIFVSVGNSAALGTVCSATNGGCLMSFNLTTLGATWPPVNATGSYNLPLSGANPGDAGSSGIIVDNVSSAAQASSIYFTFLTTASANATCNGDVSTGCAVKLTQAALQ